MSVQEMEARLRQAEADVARCAADTTAAELAQEVEFLRAAGELLLSYWECPVRDGPSYDFWEPPDGKTTRRILADFAKAIRR
jgi:hypothetical protein